MCTWLLTFVICANDLFFCRCCCHIQGHNPGHTGGRPRHQGSQHEAVHQARRAKLPAGTAACILHLQAGRVEAAQHTERHCFPWPVTVVVVCEYVLRLLNRLVSRMHCLLGELEGDPISQRTCSPCRWKQYCMPQLLAGIPV